MKVPFLDLVSQQAEVADEVLPQWERLFRDAAFIGGGAVAEFERAYADYIGVEHCIGVANGTDALELALRAVGVIPGDEVIVPANTFIATAEAVVRIGAIAVFVDVDERQLLIDPSAVEAAITGRTKAIIPVHLYGQTAPMVEILSIARRHGLMVVEDAAQAQGASSPAGRAGALGHIAATSFYPGKNLGAAGDAGAVTTNDPELARIVRETAEHGSAVKYVHDRIGFNSRLDAVQAVVLSAKLRRLDGWNARRRAAAEIYNDLLSDSESVRVPRPASGNLDVWHLYVIQVDERERVARELGAAGIATGIHYPTPLHLTGAFEPLGLRRGQFPIAEHAANRILSIPMYPHLSAADQRHVVENVRAVAGIGSGRAAI